MCHPKEPAGIHVQLRSFITHRCTHRQRPDRPYNFSSTPTIGPIFLAKASKARPLCPERANDCERLAERVRGASIVSHRQLSARVARMRARVQIVRCVCTHNTRTKQTRHILYHWNADKHTQSTNNRPSTCVCVFYWSITLSFIPARMVARQSPCAFVGVARLISFPAARTTPPRAHAVG